MDENTKFSFKGELSKLKVMGFKEKREYIWEYYKIPIIAGVILLFIIGSLINSWFINPPKQNYVSVGWVSGYESYENVTLLEDELTVAIVDDLERQTVYVPTFFQTGEPQTDMVMGQRLAAMMSVGDLNALLLDKAAIDTMAENEMIIPIESFLEEAYALNPGLEEKIANAGDMAYAAYVSDDAEAGSERLFGVPVGNCPLFERLGLYERELYFCVIPMTQKRSEAAKALVAMYE
ncbi:MAG: hypothetical protein LBR83_09155 [Clostridiales bacterium]|jgi:hypothetical protein|nr:hypothetical protein [Clostridiales bacterium]